MIRVRKAIMAPALRSLFMQLETLPSFQAVTLVRGVVSAGGVKSL
jgi:hypothetical protein